MGWPQPAVKPHQPLAHSPTPPARQKSKSKKNSWVGIKTLFYGLQSISPWRLFADRHLMPLALPVQPGADGSGPACKYVFAQSLAATTTVLVFKGLLESKSPWSQWDFPFLSVCTKVCWLVLRYLKPYQEELPTGQDAGCRIICHVSTLKSHIIS